MSFRVLQFNNLDISIQISNDSLSFFFENGYIKKTMDNADEKTLWTQSGKFYFKQVKFSKNFEESSYTIKDFEIKYDHYVYKNMVILPFKIFGNIEVKVFLNDSDNSYDFFASEAEIILEEEPKYIKHIAKKE
ncbi:MAG: hypothetical protein CMD90_01820 [Gammaproteobacteria bacterium]|nr:hypothetical protein [Gammaproteobacteria bacterium]|tara:strand:+ start:365 stop:763 length:399 start_codon:yes stop_codon:yes gene_type:complete